MKFRTRLSILFGGLLVVSLVLILVMIERVASATVIRQSQGALQTSAQTVDDLHRQRLVNLQQKVRLAAADYGFKSAYASADVPTIRSALENHRARLESADLMLLCDLDGIVIANTRAAALDQTEFPWMDLLDRAYDSETAETSGFVELDGDIYQLVIVPLLAPDIEAWVVSGFQLDNRTAAWLSSVTGSEVTFVTVVNAGTTIAATSLPEPMRADLEAQLLQGGPQGGGSSLVQGGETHIGQTLQLVAAGEPRVSALVQRSLDRALQPYRTLERIVLWILAASIVVALVVVVRISRNVTRSLTSLSVAAESVSTGDLQVQVPVTRKDEIGLLSSAFNHMVEGLAEKEMVRDLLGKVVSPEIANKLISEGVELGGEGREVTVLFCDLQGFTRLSEQKPPAELVTALNTFFSGAGDIIESHQGVVDKYIGDAVMAVFGAPQLDPDHAQHAIQCAVRLCQAADELVSKLKSDDGRGCRFGVGVHSGTVVAGNVGSRSRLNYTVIGDTVNVASRVEGQTRNFDVPLVVTESCARRCEGIEFRSLGAASLKGRQEAINIYTVDIH